MKDAVARAVTVTGLSYRYDNSTEPALDGVSLDVPQGSLTAVMGETGSGKSSLLMALNGLIPQVLEGRMDGTVEVDGQNTRAVPIHRLIRSVGLVLQDPEAQLFGATVWEDTAFGPSNLGLPRDAIAAKVRTALDKAGLCGIDRRITESLSGGEKQRLAAAGVLAIGPRILALDEPTSELDPEGKELIFAAASRLRDEEGMTVIVAEHESELVLRHADEVHVLQRGKLVWSGQPARLFADRSLVESLGLRPPGIAELYWELRTRGIDMGDTCPRTVEEMTARLERHFGSGGTFRQKQPAAASAASETAESTSAAGKLSLRERGETILRIDRLSHRYEDGCLAVDGVSLDIYRGDYIALIGRNGAGKSTLCRHLNRLLSPTSGRVLLRGEDIAGRATSELAGTIGYVFQNPDRQIFMPTVLEEVTYGLKLKGFPDPERRHKALEVLTFVGLAPFAERHPFTLGKGHRQRLAVASILALEPEVLVIDEPTTGQDWRGTQNMLSLLRSLQQRGHTIIVITHDMRIASEEANRTVIMADGRILKDCNSERAFRDPDVLRAAGIRPPQRIGLARMLGDRLTGWSGGPISAGEFADCLTEGAGSRA